MSGLTGRAIIVDNTAAMHAAEGVSEKTREVDRSAHSRRYAATLVVADLATNGEQLAYLRS